RTINAGERYLCENLFVASLPGGEGALSQWAIDYLRSRITSKPNVRSKVYLKRGSRRRRVVNEDEVATACQRQRYEVLERETTSLSEQVAMLADAALIVGAHGGALANVVFSTETTVVEVFNPDQVVPDCFTHLAKRCGHRYFWTIAGAHHTRNGDFAIDIAHLNAVISHVQVATAHQIGSRGL